MTPASPREGRSSKCWSQPGLDLGVIKMGSFSLEIVYLESTWKGVPIESMYLESSCFCPPLQKAKHFVSPKFWPVQAWSRECESQRVPKVRLGRTFK